MPAASLGWHVRQVLVSLAAFVIASCSIIGSSTPAAVAPSLDGWRRAGLSCSGPHQDGAPSGLLQWSCQGNLAGTRITANLDGDDKGVFQILAQVAPSTDRATAVAAFASLIDATPALSQVDTDVLDWLGKWGGAQATAAFGTSWALVEVDPTWITLSTFPGPRRSVNDPFRSRRRRQRGRVVHENAIVWTSGGT